MTKQRFLFRRIFFKNIFCLKVALGIIINDFFLFKKNNVSFSRYLDFCIFVKSTDLKICDAIIGISSQWKLYLCVFLLNLLKYYQIEIWSNTGVLYDELF